MIVRLLIPSSTSMPFHNVLSQSRIINFLEIKFLKKISKKIIEIFIIFNIINHFRAIISL